jgi:energy-coupling factor transport system permease protein
MTGFAGPALGQYLPGDSPLYRMDPRAKIVFVFGYLPLVFMGNSAADMVVLAAVAVSGIILSRVSLRILFGALKPVLFLIALTALFHLLLTGGGETVWKWGPLSVHEEGLRQAGRTSLRFLLVVLTASLLPLTTSPLALTDGLERLLGPLRRFGVPAHELALMMSITLRFIPTVWEEAEKIILAQQARGADFEQGSLLRRVKSVTPILIPLFVATIRRAEELALAMEARCWRGGEGRTRLRELSFTRLDVALFVLLAGVIAAVWLL